MGACQVDGSCTCHAPFTKSPHDGRCWAEDTARQVADFGAKERGIAARAAEQTKLRDRLQLLTPKISIGIGRGYSHLQLATAGTAKAAAPPTYNCYESSCSVRATCGVCCNDFIAGLPGACHLCVLKKCNKRRSSKPPAARGSAMVPPARRPAATTTAAPTPAPPTPRPTFWPTPAPAPTPAGQVAARGSCYAKTCDAAYRAACPSCCDDFVASFPGACAYCVTSKCPKNTAMPPAASKQTAPPTVSPTPKPTACKDALLKWGEQVGEASGLLRAVGAHPK
jgi:hypothetical protein